MRKYESIVIYQSGKGEAFIREAIERLRGQILASGGREFSAQEWGLRELVYPIRKETKGWYVHIQYESGANSVRELNRTLRISEDVLRHATLLAPKVQPKLRVSIGAEASSPENVDQFVEEGRS